MKRSSATTLLLALCTWLPACGDSSSATSDGSTGGSASTAGGGAGSGATSSSTTGSPSSGSGGSGSATGGSSTGGSASATGGSASSTGGSATSTGGSATGMELLHADFEATTPGVYEESMVSADFGSAPPWNNGLDEGRAAVVAEGGNRFLRITYPANQFGPADGGVQFKVPLGSSHDELSLSYRVRFAAGFEFVKGGKLPGLVGGSAPTGCIDDTTGFSARMMWRSAGAAVQYMYFPEKQNSCGDDYPYMPGGSAAHFEPDQWHTVVHRLVMNTPGQPDGILQAWFDGEPALDDQTFLFRLDGSTFSIDTLYFSTFFGGGDQSFAPSSAQVTDFDDFIVATGPLPN